MYSSVKFFDPTVSVTLPLSGFDWISPAWALVVDELLPPPPQAAMPTARIEAANRTDSARNRVLMLIESLLRFLGHLPARGDDGILCGCTLALQREPSRGQEPLHAGERELDDQREQGDQDRAREHPLVAVHVSRQDEV